MAQPSNQERGKQQDEYLHSTAIPTTHQAQSAKAIHADRGGVRLVLGLLRLGTFFDAVCIRLPQKKHLKNPNH